jgi:hypothetical protein
MNARTVDLLPVLRRSESIWLGCSLLLIQRSGALRSQTVSRNGLIKNGGTSRWSLRSHCREHFDKVCRTLQLGKGSRWGMKPSVFETGRRETVRDGD